MVPDSALQQTFFAYEMSDFSGAAREIKQAGKDVRIYKKESGYDFELVKELSRVIKEKQIEIIHTHDFGPVEYAVALKILHPRLVLVHTQHTLHHFVTNKKYVLFFQAASYFYHNVIAVSEHVKNIISAKCKFMRGTPTVIHNGVDVKRYLRLPDKVNLSAKLNLVSISRISKEKNLEHIVQTCFKLKERNIDFHLHHAGAGTQKEVESLVRLIDKCGLTQNVTLHGHKDDVRDVLKLGDIFISSSLTEGHPIAVLEAMASGKLCLCSQIPAHEKISPRGLIIFKLDDSEHLLETLLAVKAGRYNLEMKRENARKDIDEKYTLAQMINRYLDVYSASKRNYEYNRT
ncbi:MAG: hypothetical protein A2X86_13900 [Bdellovibrionales bacterium GWA2_49_15]|nr:MAG: hypothetical protein A2X86_13900 [Bdellovibrionales bacterium GWA2_49_15]